MASGRTRWLDRLGWNKTAAVLAMLANCHRDPNKRPEAYTAKDYNPYTSTEEREGVVVDEETLPLIAKFMGLK